MAYPNVTRQSATLETRLSKLLVLKANFNRLASGLTSVDELRHKATNYDLIRHEDTLTRFVDELCDYKYSLEYLQTFVKTIVNSMIANKLLDLNKMKESEYQRKLSEKSSECEASKNEITHINLLLTEASEQLEECRTLLSQHEKEIKSLKEENKTLTSNVSFLKLKVKEQTTQIESLVAETAEQYDLIEEQDTKIQQQGSKINSLETDVDKLISALHLEREALRTETQERVADVARLTKERVQAIEENNSQWRAELQENNRQWEVKFEENNRQWEVKFEENNRQWQIKYDNMVAYFKAEIAEVRGRLDNLEAQMRALHTDTEAFKTKVNELDAPLSPETKQEVVRDLANLVALSYSTASNLQLVDPKYEQRRSWFALLKEVFKLTKSLARQYDINVRQHLDFMRLMFKLNPC